MERINSQEVKEDKNEEKSDQDCLTTLVEQAGSTDESTGRARWTGELNWQRNQLNYSGAVA